MSIIVKTPEQIEGIRKSCQLASKCLDNIGAYVKAGVTTNKIDQELEQYIKQHGAIPAPKGYRVGNKTYPKATCISLNEVICHGITNDYQLKDGDILNIDVTTILNGYYGDTSRMYSVGAISEEASKLISTCYRCLQLGIQQVKSGSHVGDIGYAIVKEAYAKGYSVVDVFCGHGTGLNFHELPNIPHIGRLGSGPVLKPGYIFTIEPMINKGVKDALINEADGWTARTADGKLSAQWEDTILVTPYGCEILTK